MVAMRSHENRNATQITTKNIKLHESSKKHTFNEGLFLGGRGGHIVGVPVAASSASVTCKVGVAGRVKKDSWFANTRLQKND